ncbi:glycosyltransferase family 25 protein [Pseudoprimorskyibacter insulae]|uniref:Glycosyl transferase family 25 domain-containing protein n=1 Tax=Pseudoprimorskyibacter insulae TaxID=1695997 RepID=A0A2R8AP73_9RHOB|nr:glycosyltransferase family 25 protein [Pseudoprimorskyibacter insulae]SPF77833.1 hypothetical protein PRI8871_00419 [Pseudoprimorskyibacter insulae]
MPDDVRLYVLSLKDRNPRRASIAADLAALNLEALGVTVILFDAVDGRDGFPKRFEAMLDRDGAAQIERRALSNGEFACALGHRLMAEDFLASGSDWAIILEDDAIIDDRLHRFIAAQGYKAAPMLMLHHLNARVMGNGIAVPGADGAAYRLAMSAFMTVGYTMGRGFAKALIASQTPVRHKADWPLDLSDHGAFAIVPEVVGHPPHAVTPSSLEATRGKAARRPISSLFSLTYLKRKWRKARSRKVS